ncbi:sporulation membrane protein YtaF [Natribacillus halophilus]|uniref:Putative sporulation protein YtaF n=1 Tax=Natribacillus halophilus TaxID=549003 RepID=A0A1G8RY44_9BACI|nr:sporulation membrane protein YtaF [Natribacillus halophilus]SDJ21914.1 putative sporulation protein YtaF [Natribacillus halophilus]
MESWMALLVLAFAVSLDAFGVGMTYGMRKLKISVLPVVLIGFCSFISVLLAGLFAQVLFNYIPPQFADYLGGAILIGIGLWAIYQAMQPKEQPSAPVRKKQEGTMVNWEIKKLGLVIKVLRKPTAADMDGSGTISVKEAMLLGFALALDAFGAGFGAAMLGYPVIVFAVFVFVMCSVFLVLGKKGGFRLADRKTIDKLVFLPGLLIVCIGIFNFI